MYSLDEYKNRHPREKGRNHNEYNRATYKEWRVFCLEDARRALDDGNVAEAIRNMMQVLEEEYENVF